MSAPDSAAGSEHRADVGMRSILASRLTAVWAVLSVVALISYALGRTSHDGHRVTSSTLVTLGVLAIGVIKARLIIREFMEVRSAPVWLKRFTDIWLVVFWGAVLAIYLA